MTQSGQIRKITFQETRKHGIRIVGRLDDGNPAAGVSGTSFAGNVLKVPPAGAVVTMEGELVLSQKGRSIGRSIFEFKTMKSETEVFT